MKLWSEVFCAYILGMNFFFFFFWGGGEEYWRKCAHKILLILTAITNYDVIIFIRKYIFCEIVVSNCFIGHLLKLVIVSDGLMRLLNFLVTFTML